MLSIVGLLSLATYVFASAEVVPEVEATLPEEVFTEEVVSVDQGENKTFESIEAFLKEEEGLVVVPVIESGEVALEEEVLAETEDLAGVVDTALAINPELAVLEEVTEETMTIFDTTEEVSTEDVLPGFEELSELLERPGVLPEEETNFTPDGVVDCTRGQWSRHFDSPGQCFRALRD
jgi:hypothetical protein